MWKKWHDVKELKNQHEKGVLRIIIENEME